MTQPPSGQSHPQYNDKCDACGHDRLAHQFNAGDCYEHTMYGPCSCTGFIEQGQPQQEPAKRYNDLVEHMRKIAAYGMDVPESGRHLVDELLHEHGLQRVVGTQERQADGHHVHDFSQEVEPYYTIRQWQCGCGEKANYAEKRYYERGVADAAASKE